MSGKGSNSPSGCGGEPPLNLQIVVDVPWYDGCVSSIKTTVGEKREYERVKGLFCFELMTLKMEYRMIVGLGIQSVLFVDPSLLQHIQVGGLFRKLECERKKRGWWETTEVDPTHTHHDSHHHYPPKNTNFLKSLSPGSQKALTGSQPSQPPFDAGLAAKEDCA
jgi:hypothetical protein